MGVHGPCIKGKRARVNVGARDVRLGVEIFGADRTGRRSWLTDGRRHVSP